MTQELIVKPQTETPLSRSSYKIFIFLPETLDSIPEMRIYLLSLISPIYTRYDWIQADHIRELFIKSIESPPFLIEPGEEIHEQVLLMSLEEYALGYQGSDQRMFYSFDEFSSAHSFFVPRSDYCIGVLDLWIFRPEWFVPRRSSVEMAQECLEELLRAIPEETDDAQSIFHGSKLVDLLTSVIPVVRSGEAELIKTSEFGAESRGRWDQLSSISECPGVVRAVRSNPVLSRLLSELSNDEVSEASVFDVLSGEEDSVDLRYWTRLVEGSFEDSSLLVHFPMFYDYLLTRRSRFVSADQMARAVKFVFTASALSIPFDTLDMTSLLSRPFMSNKPHFLLANQMFKFGSPMQKKWKDLVSVIKTMDRLSGTSILLTCLPWNNLEFVSILDQELTSLGETRRTMGSETDADFVDLVIIKSLIGAGRGNFGIDTVNYFDCILRRVRIDMVPWENRVEAILDLLFLARVAYGAPSKVIKGFSHSSDSQATPSVLYIIPPEVAGYVPFDDSSSSSSERLPLITSRTSSNRAYHASRTFSSVSSSTEDFESDSSVSAISSPRSVFPDFDEIYPEPHDQYTLLPLDDEEQDDKSLSSLDPHQIRIWYEGYRTFLADGLHQDIDYDKGDDDEDEDEDEDEHGSVIIL